MRDSSRIASPLPNAEELLILRDRDVQHQIDLDARWAQKLHGRRRKLFRWGMGQLPWEERAAIKLSLTGRTQDEIARVLGVEQATICYRLQRAQARLRWLCTVGRTVTAAELDRETRAILRAEDRRILLEWWSCGSQSEVARRVFGDAGRQSRVRSSLIFSIGLIEKIRGLKRIHAALESLWKHGQILGGLYGRKRLTGA